MPLQYRRRIKLIIGVTASEQIEISNQDDDDETLRVTFDIAKGHTSGRNPNSGRVSVYNLNADSRERLENATRKLSLSAGYGDSADLLYTGRVVRVLSERETPNWVTNFWVSDDLQESTQERTIRRSFVAGVSAQELIRSVIESFGNTATQEQERQIAALGTLRAPLGPTVLSGDSAVVMETLAQTYGFDWGPQDGSIEIVKRDGFTGEQLEDITPETGMIGSPKATYEGVQVTTLLNPAHRVWRRVNIRSNAAQLRGFDPERISGDIPFFKDGMYILTDVNFVGDTHGNEWFSHVRTFPRFRT